MAIVCTVTLTFGLTVWFLPATIYCHVIMITCAKSFQILSWTTKLWGRHENVQSVYCDLDLWANSMILKHVRSSCYDFKIPASMTKSWMHTPPPTHTQMNNQHTHARTHMDRLNTIIIYLSAIIMAGAWNHNSSSVLHFIKTKILQHNYGGLQQPLPASGDVINDRKSWKWCQIKGKN